TLEPNNIRYRYLRVWLDAWERVDIRALHALLEKIFDDAASLSSYAQIAFINSVLLRNPVAADRAMAATTANTFALSGGVVQVTRAYAQGLVARMKGDDDVALAAFGAARTEQEKVVGAQPDDWTKSPALCLLGLIDAALGRTQEALSEGRRAV